MIRALFLIVVLLALLFVRPARSLPSFKQHSSDYHNIHINTAQCVFETDARFLSIALDSQLIRRKWEKFNFASDKLQNLAHGLSPAFLRLGGTDEDFILFHEEDDLNIEGYNGELKFKVKHDRTNSTENPTMAKSSDNHNTTDNTTTTVSNINHQVDEYTNFTMNASDIDNIFNFANKAELDVIFGLNVLLRTPEKDWDSHNAEKLMAYIAGKQYGCAWELGNEPMDLKGLVNKTITGKQLANDFNKLRQLLTKHSDYGRFIVGPDVSSPWNGVHRPAFLEEFLSNIDTGSINGMTYHQYYTNNQASVSDFYNPAILDRLITEILKVDEIMKRSGATGLPPWLGETASAYGGGVRGVSDSYIAGFMWLDKLGVAACLRHKVVIRQVFYGGYYGLIDKQTLDPYPDYWTSLLYKKLVGAKTLTVRNGLDFNRAVRVYAHCTSERSGYQKGAIVVLALNTLHHSTRLSFTDQLHGLAVEQYVLTPGHDGNLTSQMIKLNGEVLALVNDTYLPDMKPARIVPPQDISLPPVSYGFFVIPDAKAEACMSECLYANEDSSVKL